MTPDPEPGEPDADDSARRTAAQQRALKGLGPALKWGPALAELADAVTTDMALHGGGAHEANPVLAPWVNNKPAFYATKVGTGILFGLLGDKLAKDGHPTLGKLVSGVNIAVPLGAATHNVIEMGKKH